jgi:uncharacterized protein YuzE
MQLTYDPEARAVYLQLRDGDIARTVADGRGLMLDLDAAGQLLGVEVLVLEELSRVPSVLAARGAPAVPGIDFVALAPALCGTAA